MNPVENQNCLADFLVLKTHEKLFFLGVFFKSQILFFIYINPINLYYLDG